MQTLEMDYEAYKAEAFSGRYLVRAFQQWNAWAAVYQAQPVLLLDEFVHRRVTVCFYDTEAQRENDIMELRTLYTALTPYPSPGGTPPPASSAAAAALCLPPPPLSKRKN